MSGLKNSSSGVIKNVTSVSQIFESSRLSKIVIATKHAQQTKFKAWNFVLYYSTGQR